MYERHGGMKTPLWYVWSGMRQRCSNTNREDFSDYGGRGITVCDEWNRSFGIFQKWAMENGYRPRLLLDRKDNNGNYDPGNCRWVTHSVSVNNRRTTVRITAFGETKCLADWAADERCMVAYPTLHYRLSRNWLPEKAISTKSLIPRS